MKYDLNDQETKNFNHYPEYISKKQMCEMLGVSQKTGYNILKRGDISFIYAPNKPNEYLISKQEVLRYFCHRRCRESSDSFYITQMRHFYEIEFRSYPDVISVLKLSKITGYCKSAILGWISKGVLKALSAGRGYFIPKVYILDFVTSPYYRRIRRKSKIHKMHDEKFVGYLHMKKNSKEEDTYKIQLRSKTDCKISTLSNLS